MYKARFYICLTLSFSLSPPHHSSTPVFLSFCLSPSRLRCLSLSLALTGIFIKRNEEEKKYL